MRFLLAGLLLLISFIGYAAIYMEVDKKGQIQYSDMPLPNAQRIDIPAIINAPTDTLNNARPPSESAPPEDMIRNKSHPVYSFLSIASPANEETFQNQRNIPISIKIDPELQKEDRIQLYLDGKPYGKPRFSTQFELFQVDRGTHQVYAIVIDKFGVILKQSNIITIYIHYAHI